MTLLKRIKEAQLQSRKNRDGFRSSLLTTIIGEAEMVGKNSGNRESTDAEVIQVLKKFEKNLNESISHLYKRGSPIDTFLDEVKIIQEFLPQRISDEQVRHDISFAMEQTGLVFDAKNMGKLIPIMKEHYGDSFDGQQVSTIFKSMMK